MCKEQEGPEIPAEEGLFHYPGFANASCPTYAEATDRFIYGAWNVYRIDAGNPHFGSVSFVRINCTVRMQIEFRQSRCVCVCISFSFSSLYWVRGQLRVLYCTAKCG